MIVDLSDAHDVELVGGKAASLGKLLQSKINTPSGFVITTQAEFPLAAKIQDEILSKFDQTFSTSTKVAVRSSGVNEDGMEKSFAGQFDTFLNINRNNLICKITEVHTSARSQRILKYNQGIEASIAVVIQEMINPSVSGVAFSVNIITGSRDEIMIEATSGLGEKLVSGLVTPDLFVIKKDSGNILTHETGDHTITLKPKNLANLTDQINRIERFYGHPVDIEWAIANGQIYILQTRPITVLR